MIQEVRLRDLNDLTVKLLLLILFSILQIIIEKTTFSEAPQDLVTFLFNLCRYFTMSLLFIFFLIEFFQIINPDISSLNFKLKERGIAYLQDPQLWIAMFETLNLNDIQVNELKQLKHLKTFSLELNRIKRVFRVFIYSKSYEEIKKRIDKFGTVLDVILPGINLVSNETMTEFFNNNKIVNLSNHYILTENSQLIIPQTEGEIQSITNTFTSIILANNFLNENGQKNIDKLKNSSQIYFLTYYDKNLFYKFLNDLVFTKKNALVCFGEHQKLERIRMRFQIKDQSKIYFQQGLNKLKHELNNLSKESSSSTLAKTTLFHPSSKKKIVINERTTPSISLTSKNQARNEESTLSSTQCLQLPINQICFELCNIQKDLDLPLEEKVKKCNRRAKFSGKLLKSDNFTSLIENILNQEYKEEKLFLLSELNHHLSFQQLLCLLAHMILQMEENRPLQKIVSLLHILLELNYINCKEHKISEKSPTSLNVNGNSVYHLSSS